MSRPPRIVLDVAAQAHDEVVDRASVGIFAQSPDLFEHRLPRHRLSFVLDQVAEDVGFHERQRKYLIANADLEQVEVYRYVAERETGWRRRHGSRFNRRRAQPLAAP